MSSIPQTPAPERSRFSALAPRLAMATIVLLAVGPRWRWVLGAAEHARLHWPRLAAFQALPPAIRLHILGALGALVLGAALMLVRKGRLFHRTAGWVWVGLVSLVAGSSLFITSLNHGRWSILHLFTAWTLITLPLAVFWVKRHEVARHRRVMMGLFYGAFVINMFIAFIPGRTMWRLFFG